MRSVLNVVLGVFLLCAINCCTQKPKKVEKRILIHPNPTSYVFDMPMHDLKDTLLKIFDVSPQMYDKTLLKVFHYKFPENKDGRTMQAMFEPEIADSAAFGTDYFKKPGNKNNIFLTQMGDHWISPMYYTEDGPLECTSSYSIEFSPISPIKTSITIKAYKPQVINGTTCCGPHGNYSIYQDVEPTTVEEYTLILYITQQLGMKGLPPLQMPR